MHVTSLLGVVLRQQHLSVFVQPEAVQICQNADHGLALTTAGKRTGAHISV